MSSTDTNVIATSYNAQFRAEPFARPRWTVSSGMQYRETLKRRRRWTVASDLLSQPGAVVSQYEYARHYVGNLLDSDASIVFIADSPGSRYGVAVVLEQVAR